MCKKCKVYEKITAIYGTYTDQIEFTEEDIIELDKLETQLAKE
jgi:hypothetical protein